ncbi:helix-turn-helix domain-containing protein [Micromonospora sp. CB01531]|uniref:helix-turn-helix domain-containing protein n=1 Tax=Micromonospora sp. CB01531 TaxID=1718947 RepID=UPI00093D01FC|nr:cupin domain-containing protein [Micromonospora sp. CB01531]OKI63393.1 XRE family transcriptional regulator [Micromonospora sp. CB01531]
MLGDRLRELRLRHGMTLRQLATAAEVSPALLSQLENNVTDPSLSTLRKLATVFKAEVSALFSEPNAPTVHLSRPGERMRLTAPLGEIAYERLTPGRGDLEMLSATMNPGDVSASERRGHESTECIVVLEGEVVVEVEQHRYVLNAQDSLTFDSRLPHRFCNESLKPARFLLAVTPPVP